MTLDLTACTQCSLPFRELPFPALEEELFMTSCFHIFHKTCAAGWVNSAIKSCPVCKHLCYQHEAGKNFQQIWTIFLKALPKLSDTVLQTLDQSLYANSTCAICQYAPSLIPLFYDPHSKRLVHATCTPQESFRQLTVDTIVEVVRRCAEKDAALKDLLTPTPPSLYERLGRDYSLSLPHLATLTAAATLAALCLLSSFSRR